MRIKIKERNEFVIMKTKSSIINLTKIHLIALWESCWVEELNKRILSSAESIQYNYYTNYTFFPSQMLERVGIQMERKFYELSGLFLNNLALVKERSLYYCLKSILTSPDIFYMTCNLLVIYEQRKKRIEIITLEHVQPQPAFLVDFCLIREQITLHI